MNSAYVYLQLYRLFDESTPTGVDCGRLCGAACCLGDESGMYLFPGEKKVYELLAPSWIRLERSDFSYEYNGAKKNLFIAFCSGECDRYQRPLACRIFPLTPIISADGRLDVIVDPRSKSVCPLGKAFELSDFDAQFVKNVKKAFCMLCKNKEFSVFMREYSDYLREFERFV